MRLKLLQNNYGLIIDIAFFFFFFVTMLLIGCANNYKRKERRKKMKIQIKKISRIIIICALVMSFILGGTHEAHAAVAEPTNVTYSGFWNYKIKRKGVKNVNGYEIKVQYAYENGGYAGTYYYVTSKNR